MSGYALLEDLCQRAEQSAPPQYSAKSRSLLYTYQDVFSKTKFDVGVSDIIQHEILTKIESSPPIKKMP